MIKGILLIFFSSYGFLMALGYLPLKTTKPEEMALWREKYGFLLKIVCPFLFLIGVVNLLKGL